MPGKECVPGNYVNMLDKKTLNNIEGPERKSQAECKRCGINSHYVCDCVCAPEHLRH